MSTISNTTDKSYFAPGQLAIKIAKAIEAEGGTPEEINDIAQDGEFLRLVLGAKRGTHEFTPKQFPIWKTITIGDMSKDELITDVKENFSVSSYAAEMMNHKKFIVRKKETKVKLVKAQVKDLGFTSKPTTTELFERIKEVGDLCPAEVGPQLRRQYGDQPNGEYLWIAMEQFPGSGGGPSVFSVGRDSGGRWLSGGGWVGPGDRWSLGNSVVFVARNSSALSS